MELESRLGFVLFPGIHRSGKAATLEPPWSIWKEAFLPWLLVLAFVAVVCVSCWLHEWAAPTSRRKMSNAGDDSQAEERHYAT